jgi:hypothetical protein
MTVAGQIEKGACFDSVTLRRVGIVPASLPGSACAIVVTGTETFEAVIAAAGLLISRPGQATDAAGRQSPDHSVAFGLGEHILKR